MKFVVLFLKPGVTEGNLLTWTSMTLDPLVGERRKCVIGRGGLTCQRPRRWKEVVPVTFAA